MKRTIIIVAAIVTFGIAGGAVAAEKITGKDIKDSTITAKDVKNRSLLAKDFKPGQLPRGAQGAPGPAGLVGPQGPQGPAGPSALSGITTVAGSMTIAAGDVNGGTVACPPGQRVVSGGFEYISADGEVFVEEANGDRSGYTVLVDNFDSSIEADLTVIGYCAGAGKAVAARNAKPRLRAPSGKAARLLRRQRAVLAAR